MRAVIQLTVMEPRIEPEVSPADRGVASAMGARG